MMMITMLMIMVIMMICLAKVVKVSRYNSCKILATFLNHVKHMNKQ